MAFSTPEVLHFLLSLKSCTTFLNALCLFFVFSFCLRRFLTTHHQKNKLRVWSNTVDVGDMNSFDNDDDDNGNDNDGNDDDVGGWNSKKY